MHSSTGCVSTMLAKQGSRCHTRCVLACCYQLHLLHDVMHCLTVAHALKSSWLRVRLFACCGCCTSCLGCFLACYVALSTLKQPLARPPAHFAVVFGMYVPHLERYVDNFGVPCSTAVQRERHPISVTGSVACLGCRVPVFCRPFGVRPISCLLSCCSI